MLTAANQWQALAAATYVFNMMLIKLSIGIFLLRLSTGKIYKWIINISLFAIFVWSMVSFFRDVFQCRPVVAQWDLTSVDNRCASSSEVVRGAYAISVMIILADWLYVSRPVAIPSSSGVVADLYDS